MRTNVQVEAQVENFVKSLAPDPRKRLIRAIKALANDQGDVKRLEGRLEGYSRLRLAGYRVLFIERSAGGQRILDCVYAEKRPIVYELFIRLLSESLQ